MTNTYKLSYTGAEIDEKLGKIDELSETKVSINPQVLTEEQKAQARVNIGVSENTALTPDIFTGTDSEKLQACFDELVNTGGIIRLEREYTLSANLVISHNSNRIHRIIVRGNGKYAKINFGEFSIIDNEETSADGGILFEDVEFVGTKTMMNAHGLIRMFFSNCTFSNFEHIIYNADGYIQTCHFTNCVIRNTTDVAIKTIATATTTQGNAGCLYDLTITNCLIEWCAGLIEASSVHGCSVTHNCIEGFGGVPIVVRYMSRGFDICGNYFEANDSNGNGVNINISSLGYRHTAITIQNNYFAQWNGTTGVIKLPARRGIGGGIVINGNVLLPQNEYLLQIPDSVTEKLNVYAFGNVGEISGNPLMISSLTPENVATVDEVLAALPMWEGGSY